MDDIARYPPDMESMDASHLRSVQHNGDGYPFYFHETRMNPFLPHQGLTAHSVTRDQVPINGQRQSYNPHYGMLQVEPLQGFLYDTMSTPARTQHTDLTSGRFYGNSPKISQSAPAAKRQKIRNLPSGNEKIQIPLASSRERFIPGFPSHETFPSDLNEDDDAVSLTGSRVSECCSSCSEGLPCDEPDCEKQKDAVIPCSKQSCDVPVCSDSCLPEATGQQKKPWQQHTVPASERISAWESTSWTPQAPRASSPRSLDEKIDPALLSAAKNLPIASRSQSPDPETPSMAHNMRTPFSPGQAIVTPDFTDNPSQTSFSNGTVVSGTGTMFDVKSWATDLFPDSTFENGMLNCAWGECTVPFATPEEWSTHLHQAHVDPQMTFDCPLQSGCQSNINSHPLDHLQAAHGFDVTYSSFSCPAPACAPENQVFCNPAMLHNHFDQAHATPATGSLFCQWNDCNSTFTDQRELLYHLTEDHRLIHPTKEVSTERSSNQPEMTKYPTAIEDEELSEDEGRSACQWNTGSSVCGVICENPKELQDHITEHHLKTLNKTTGYYCQWDNCNRQKLGTKAGFSQRGKLIRHMQTHTILKEEVCDFPGCGRQFSAKQALLQHKRIHTGEKPFKCSHCDRAFAQQSACTMHERTHTGLKPLQCEHCGKRFSESSNLSKHRRMHQAEKEKKGHKCDFAGCGKAFVRFASLRNHKKEAHGGIDQHPMRASASSEPDTEENAISSPAPSTSDPSDDC